MKFDMYRAKLKGESYLFVYLSYLLVCRLRRMHALKLYIVLYCLNKIFYFWGVLNLLKVFAWIHADLRAYQHKVSVHH